jgi:hypothetical protein
MEWRRDRNLFAGLHPYGKRFERKLLGSIPNIGPKEALDVLDACVKAYDNGLWRMADHVCGRQNQVYAKVCLPDDQRA